MNDVILRGSEKISALLDVEFSYSPARHSFELGLPLESALRTFFRPFFPSRYGFSSGYLVDERNTVSSQIDWIIYDSINAAPIIPRSSNSDNIEWFPIDCVFGTVEVKRTLNKETLQKACAQTACTKNLRRQPTDLYRFFPYADYKPLYDHLRPDLKDHERLCNYLYNGIYSFQVEEGSNIDSPDNFIDYVTNLADDIGYDHMPDFIAVHGRFFLRKVLCTDHGKIDFTRFVAATNGFGILQTQQNTAGIFYLDLLSQFANTLLSMQYQTSVVGRIFKEITGGTISIARRRPTQGGA